MELILTCEMILANFYSEQWQIIIICRGKILFSFLTSTLRIHIVTLWYYTFSAFHTGAWEPVKNIRSDFKWEDWIK